MLPDSCMQGRGGASRPCLQGSRIQAPDFLHSSPREEPGSQHPLSLCRDWGRGELREVPTHPAEVPAAMALPPPVPGQAGLAAEAVRCQPVPGGTNSRAGPESTGLAAHPAQGCMAGDVGAFSQESRGAGLTAQRVPTFR